MSLNPILLSYSKISPRALLLRRRLKQIFKVDFLSILLENYPFHFFVYL